MSDLATNLKNSLLQLKGKPANHLTRALKSIGGGENGSMVDGAIRIVDALDKDKKRSVALVKRIYGVGGIFIGTAIMGGVWFYSKKKEKQKYKEECKIIIKTFENEVKAAKAVEDSDVIYNAIETDRE